MLVAMKIVFRCVIAVCLISSVVAAAPPSQVFECFAAAQNSMDKEVFRGSYSMTIQSSINKPGGDPQEVTEMEWSVAVDPAGEESRRLMRLIVDGEDLTEKKREKVEGRQADDDDEQEDGMDVLSPFGEKAHLFVFGPALTVDDRVEMSFEPARGHEDDKGISRGSVAWDAATLDPLWLAMEAVRPPKPVREIRMRLEFERVGEGVYLRRLTTEGKAKVLLMKREFQMEMTVSDLVPASGAL